MAVNKKIPMRKCVGCGEMKPKKELLRILRTETGEFVVDALGKANGRGAYLCRSVECFQKAVKNRGLEKKVFGQYVYVFQYLWEQCIYLNILDLIIM